MSLSLFIALNACTGSMSVVEEKPGPPSLKSFADTLSGHTFPILSFSVLEVLSHSFAKEASFHELAGLVFAGTLGEVAISYLSGSFPSSQ